MSSVSQEVLLNKKVQVTLKNGWQYTGLIYEFNQPQGKLILRDVVNHQD